MADKKVLTAAYVPFKTFLNSLDHLKSHGIPNGIDRSYFPSQSGTVQGMIISAFKFFKLIDESGKPSDDLAQLVNADEKERKRLMRALLETNYASIFNEGLQKLTPAQLDNLFSPEAYGVQGDTRNKAKAFFFFALKFADVPYNKMLAKSTRVRGIRRRRSAPEGAQNNGNQGAARTSQTGSVTTGNQSQAMREINLQDSKKNIWLGTDANLLEIKFGRDMDFVLAVMKLFDMYERGEQVFVVSDGKEQNT